MLPCNHICVDLRGGKGGPPGEGHWETGVRAPSWDGGRPIPPPPIHNSSEGSCHVPLGKGWIGDPGRQRGCWGKGAGHEIVGGDEEGEEGAVDGVVGGPRVGKERLLSHDRVKIV